ncbi:MAG: autotransporter outer membrane beta-barrel domain-containing protein [Acidaminococcaceae bacterium]
MILSKQYLAQAIILSLCLGGAVQAAQPALAAPIQLTETQKETASWVSGGEYIFNVLDSTDTIYPSALSLLDCLDSEKSAVTLANPGDTTILRMVKGKNVKNGESISGMRLGFASEVEINGRFQLFVTEEYYDQHKGELTMGIVFGQSGVGEHNKFNDQVEVTVQGVRSVGICIERPWRSDRPLEEIYFQKEVTLDVTSTSKKEELLGWEGGNDGDFNKGVWMEGQPKLTFAEALAVGVHNGGEALYCMVSDSGHDAGMTSGGQLTVAGKTTIRMDDVLGRTSTGITTGTVDYLTDEDKPENFVGGVVNLNGGLDLRTESVLDNQEEYSLGTVLRGSQKGINVTDANWTVNVAGDTSIVLGSWKNKPNAKDALAITCTDGAVNINQARNGTVNLQGVVEQKGVGTVNVALTNAQSWWDGDAIGAPNIELAQGGTWRPSGMADPEFNNKLQLNLHAGGIVDLTKSNVTRGDKPLYNNLNIGTVNGTGGVFKLKTDVANKIGDQILISNSTTNGTHQIDIVDVNEKDMSQVKPGSGSGLVLITAPKDMNFTAQAREGSIFNIHYELGNQEVGADKQWLLTGMKQDDSTGTGSNVNTVLNVNAMNYYAWRQENNTLRQRLGDLRQQATPDYGLWTKITRGKMEHGGQRYFDNSYTTYEMGYDQKIKTAAPGSWLVGGAIRYNDGKGTYSTGKGENNSKAFSLYGTQLGDKGHYLDLVLKVSKLKNEFMNFMNTGEKVTGTYDNWGTSISAEYGRKTQLKAQGWYIEPQVQLTMGHLGSADYMTSNGIHVQQDGMNSVVGRIGFNLGKNIDAKTNFYVKANLEHEFAGQAEVSFADKTGNFTDAETFNDTWFTYGLGVTLQTGPNNNIYFDLERSSGSDYRTNWQVNAGTRWSF